MNNQIAMMNRYCFVLFVFFYTKDISANDNDGKKSYLRRKLNETKFQWPLDSLIDDQFNADEVGEPDGPDNDTKFQWPLDSLIDDQFNTNVKGKPDGPDEPDNNEGTTNVFKITLKHMGRDTTYNAIFEKAARRWEKIIVGDLPDVPKRRSSSHSWFGNDFRERVNVDIDDVLIGYEMEEIDGEGGVLGYAGPVYTRTNDPSRITAISGIMKFDKVDFAGMPYEDIELVIIHEMGHVLGIGTFWEDKCGVRCYSGATTYTCDKAKAEYKALGYSDNLKLEPDVCGHWSESNFGFKRDEIMTPYFDEGKYQPISRITTAALYDLGYEVDFGASDAWNKQGRSLKSGEIETLVPTHSFKIDETSIIKPKMQRLSKF